MSRDSQTDSNRDRRPAPRDAYMRDLPDPGGTLWDEKQALVRQGIKNQGATRGAADVRPAGDE